MIWKTNKKPQTKPPKLNNLHFCNVSDLESLEEKFFSFVFTFIYAYIPIKSTASERKTFQN